MSAPVGERVRAASVPAQRGTRALAPRGGGATRPAVASPAPGGDRAVAAAAARAYARRDERSRRVTGPPAERVAAGRPRFVLVMMTLLAVGLVATLWLSTAAAADSYRLEDARSAARQMSEQSERLHREVASMVSPTSLAERAADLGMVPMQDSARLVVGDDGDVKVVGTPHAAVAPRPPAPPAGEPCPAPSPAPAAGDAAAPSCRQAAEASHAAASAGESPAASAGERLAASARGAG